MALDCSSELSGDYYGIGVRLGIYLVWLTSWLANSFLPDEISGALDANAIFLLALLASIFRGTILQDKRQLRYIDGLVLMQLCAGYMFGCFSLWGYRTVHYQNEGRKGIRHFGNWGTHFRLILATAISAYGVWFWLEGIKDGLSPLRDDAGRFRAECYPLVTFFFGKLDAKGPIRVFYVFVSISCTIYYGLMCVVAAVERTLRVIGSHQLFLKGGYETGLNVKELHYLFLFCRVGNLIWMIFSAIMVEMTLNWNHTAQVVGVNGKVAFPAQLLPLLIGALGCVRIIYLIYRDRTTPKHDDEECQAVLEKEAAQPSADLNVHHRSFGLRALVAWLPWLSVSHIWRRPTNENENADLRRQAGTNPRDSSMPLMAGTPITPSTPGTMLSSDFAEKNTPTISYSATSPQVKED